MERRFSDETAAALDRMGHSVNWWRDWEWKAGCVCAIVKDTTTDTARTTVTRLERGDLVGELVRMLGAEDGDAAARRHARELLKAA